MNMRKILSLAFVCSMVLVCALSLSACGKKSIKSGIYELASYKVSGAEKFPAMDDIYTYTKSIVIDGKKFKASNQAGTETLNTEYTLDGEKVTITNITNYTYKDGKIIFTSTSQGTTTIAVYEKK